MNQSVSPAVKLLIQSGVVPENVLQQLISWKLLPENFSFLHGDHPVNLESNWESVEDFVGNLKTALTEEMGSIRETEFDRVGGFKRATLLAHPGGIARVEDVFVDRLGRVLFPVRHPFDEAELVSLDRGPFREIVRREPRYEGENQIAWVCYLEPSEDGESHAH